MKRKYCCDKSQKSCDDFFQTSRDREDSKNLLVSEFYDEEADDVADKEREKEENSLSISSLTLSDVGELLFARERFEIATSLFEQVSLFLFDFFDNFFLVN